MSKTCKVEGCGKPSHARGYCSMHSSRLRRGGSLECKHRDKSCIASKNKKEYKCFLKMKDRCCNKNSPDYADYGGRGIKVCDRWLEKPYGFRNFLEDMGPKPEGTYPSGCPIYSLDRIDVNDDYCPENCRWATAKQQANNRRLRKDACLYTHNGETKTLKEWSEISGIPLRKLCTRYHNKKFDNDKLLEQGDLRCIIKV